MTVDGRGDDNGEGKRNLQLRYLPGGNDSCTEFYFAMLSMLIQIEWCPHFYTTTLIMPRTVWVSLSSRLISETIH